MRYTPLRYSGGKSKLSPVIKRIIDLNDLHGCYIEPYAGGAGLALNLLFTGYCGSIHLNDLDCAVFNFWKSVTEQTDELIRKIYDTDITIEEWRKQKEIIKNKDVSPLEQGFAALFLNRVNRSGILKGGVIGGVAQSGLYKMTDRFNKVEIIKRIEKIGEVAEKIQVSNLDAAALLATISPRTHPKSLIYLDPPYYEKGYQLYRHFYRDEDHIKLKEQLDRTEVAWVLSYDNHIKIRELYSGYQNNQREFNYVAGTKRKGMEIMIYSNNLNIQADLLNKRCVSSILTC